LAALDELCVVLAANISRAADIAVDYERENDSHGRLIVTFADVLAQPSSPTWSTTNPPPAPIPDGLAAVLDDLENDQDDEPVELFPPLRMIPGEQDR
jgi:hypothetical protein